MWTQWMGIWNRLLNGRAPGQKNSFKWPLKLFSEQRWRIDNILSHHYPREERGVTKEEVRRWEIEGGTGEREIEAEAIFSRLAPDSSAAFGSCHNLYSDCFFFLLCRSVLDVQIRSGAPVKGGASWFVFLFNEAHSSNRPNTQTRTYPSPSLLPSPFSSGLWMSPRSLSASLEFCWGSLIFHWDHGNRECPPLLIPPPPLL